ncbi:hypothetical protein [Vulcanisaeta sp. JCM 14467]|uniref:hypothetical protein n=1 Tax=Vulcanisaeta sp. JCM 14467 TaxID=1295370 RepID=UPI000B081C0E|nr:hypothetical protein [Vulcanisaeta sp. JCM 14467]
MSGDPRDGRIIIINEDGLCVDLMTGEVIEAVTSWRVPSFTQPGAFTCPMMRIME